MTGSEMPSSHGKRPGKIASAAHAVMPAAMGDRLGRPRYRMIVSRVSTSSHGADLREHLPDLKAKLIGVLGERVGRLQDLARRVPRLAGTACYVGDVD